MKIYTAKKIYTVDNNFTSAQAMAINNGKIIELGNLTELSAKYPEAVIVSDYENTLSFFISIILLIIIYVSNLEGTPSSWCRLR